MPSFGEPGAAIDATQETIARRFGVEQIVDGYGLTEVWPLGGNCPLSRALHIPEDVVAESGPACVSPRTTRTSSWGDNAARIFKLDVPFTRLFKPPSDRVGRSDKNPATAGAR